MFSASRNILFLTLILLCVCACDSDDGLSMDSAGTAAEARSTDVITIQTTIIEEVQLEEPILATGTTAALKVTNIKPMARTAVARDRR